MIRHHLHVARLLGFALLALAAAAFPSRSEAGTFKVLHSFCQQANCFDGYGPFGGLLVDKSGNLYGTTYHGGKYDGGTVLEVTASGKEKILYDFCKEAACADGAYPVTTLIMDTQGNLYGTTEGGGAHDYGTVFEISASGKETVLYSFCSLTDCTDGEYPYSGLVMDGSGNLYGTTYKGGAHGDGAVFKVSGTESVLYSFCSQTDCTDGEYPYSALIMDGSGNLYGTTYEGGAHGRGTAFELSGSTESVLYSFCSQTNCTDGEYPYSNLIMDAKSNLYGTTYEGGGYGYGTVFELSGGTESVLYSFCGQVSCIDGAYPYLGSLVMDKTGNLYGTTYEGGFIDAGTVFEVKAGGGEVVLHNFCSEHHCDDGAYPYFGLAADSSGNLYGTAYYYGRFATGGELDYGGTLFKLSP